MRISHSAKEKYTQCPKSYQLYYKDNIRSTKESSALKFGGALDLALNELLTSKDINNSLEIFNSEWSKFENTPVINYFKSDLDESLLSGLDLLRISQIENIEMKNHIMNWISLKQKAYKLINIYHDRILPHIKRVISIQQNISLQNEEGDEITGITDLICEVIPDLSNPDHTLIAVMDNKTASSPYVKNSFMTKEQTALYTYSTGIENAGFFVLNKKDFKYQIIVGKVPEKLQEKVIADFVEVLDNIKSEKFPKRENKKECFFYGSKCLFFNYCWNNSMEGLYVKKSNKESSMDSSPSDDAINGSNDII